MSRVILTLILTSLLQVTLAQQEPQFSHYMYNQVDYNPGSAGSKDAINLCALGRQQWMGFPGKPAVSSFSASAPVKPFKVNSGIGLVFQNDKLGYNKDIKVKLAYAYRMNVNNGIGKLGIGISAGFLNKAFDAEWQTSDGGTGTDDVAIPGADESGTAFDLGLGLFYKTEDLYLGLSATNLLQSPVSFSTTEYTNTRHYYVTAGYNIPLTNRAFDVQPSLLLMTDAKTSSVDLNTVIVYNKRLWGGVSYRLSSGFIGMVGIELLSGLRIGYSYDMSTTELNKYNSGTHELMVGYSFTLVKEKIPYKNKSVRFL